MKNLDRAIIGMKELERFIVPILKGNNYQGQGEGFGGTKWLKWEETNERNAIQR